MKIILIIITAFCLNAKADQWEFFPSVTVGAGFQFSMVSDSHVYAQVQAYPLKYGGEEGGIRFLGVGTTLGSDPTFIFSPASACIMDKFCAGPHFGKNLSGFGFAYSINF